MSESPTPDSTGVKSTAVVKYSASQSPATFAQLQCNTDLNLPPANWLSNSASVYGLQHVLSHSTGFSSFRMAHMFPDCVGEVDVVSDAENIKNLLKLPYSHDQVSMMVHRVENTLLIDEFDIYKHLLRTAEKEWEWLRKFFYEHVRKSFSEKDRNLYLQNKSRNALQQKSLVSKFLYHSLVQKLDDDTNSYEENVVDEKRETFPISGPALPDPSIEEEVPDSSSNHKFNRNVVWTFENIQMLIGTDMPIFGGSTHPCISLRLRDMSSPISVLTGIDYWLDNLMSNVPEVVMCYHLNGIVQKYELIKTEDLPNLENSKFSPSVIRDIAQNILSFLKSNATKAGHTYWLFKSKDDDVVKLYDLTSLCTEEKEPEDQNPFTIPVAMLLYRVARNMKCTSGRKQPGTIRMLLKNCIDLLQKDKYPQIVTSSHYMISDLYVPANTDPAAPGLEHMETDDMESCYEDDLTDDGEATKLLRLGNTDGTNNNFVYKPPPPITGTLEERCLHALNHVLSGLECLQYFPLQDADGEELKKKVEQARKRDEEDNPTMARPFTAIPMPYEELNPRDKNTKCKKQKKRKNRAESTSKEPPNALLLKPNQEAIPTWQEPDRSDNASWNIHLKTLLYEKACLVFAILAEQDYVLENYGSSIKNIEMLIRCHEVLQSLKFSSRAVQESCLLGRAGDACFMIVKNWDNVDKYRQQLIRTVDIHVKVLEYLDKEETLKDSKFDKSENLSVLPEELLSIEQMLLASSQCYEQALKSNLVQDRKTLSRRLGNIQNELGVFYTHKAGEDTEFFFENYNRALNYLQYGIKTFECARDDANLALLYSNLGRLMRLCSHFYSTGQISSSKRKQKTQEQVYYNKALDNYQNALISLKNRNDNPIVWDTVTWELSTALFTRASLLQDYPTGEQNPEMAEKEVIETLQKALRYCDMETPGHRQPIYQYRVACIHHRLASLYHSSYRKINSVNHQRRKQLLQLCHLHYERACKIFSTLEQHTELIKCFLERVALSEFIAKGSSTSMHNRIENHQFCLYLMIEIIPSLQWAVSKAHYYRELINNNNHNEKQIEKEEEKKSEKEKEEEVENKSEKMKEEKVENEPINNNNHNEKKVENKSEKEKENNEKEVEIKSEKEKDEEEKKVENKSEKEKENEEKEVENNSEKEKGNEEKEVENKSENEEEKEVENKSEKEKENEEKELENEEEKEVETKPEKETEDGEIINIDKLKEEAIAFDGQFITYTTTLEQQLQFALKMLAKLCLNKSSCDIAKEYKQLYSVTLKLDNKKEWYLLLSDLIEILLNLEALREAVIKRQTQTEAT